MNFRKNKAYKFGVHAATVQINAFFAIGFTQSAKCYTATWRFKRVEEDKKGIFNVRGKKTSNPPYW